MEIIKSNSSANATISTSTVKQETIPKKKKHRTKAKAKKYAGIKTKS